MLGYIHKKLQQACGKNKLRLAEENYQQICIQPVNVNIKKPFSCLIATSGMRGEVSNRHRSLAA